MKKIIFAFIICISTSFYTSAQTPSLNKQQTLEYITKLWKANYDDADGSLTSVTLDGKVLTVITSKGKSHRTDLTIINPRLLLISNDIFDGKTYYFIHIEGSKAKSIIFGIQLESDALRLKKALEHLIEIVKAEKSTDPFDD